MSPIEKVQVVLLSVVTAAAISLGVGKWMAPGNQRIDTIGPNDDAPIIMAGGSLYLGTGPDGVLKPDGNGLAFTSGFKVFGVDFTDQNDTTQSAVTADVSGKAGALIVTYCKNDCSNPAQTDVVTLNFDPNSISISNTLASHPISRMPKLLPTLRLHMRKRWKMSSVELKIAGATFGTVAQCGNDSECNVVVHTCKQGIGCQ